MEMCDESREAPRVTDAGVRWAELSDPVALVSRLHYVSRAADVCMMDREGVSF